MGTEQKITVAVLGTGVMGAPMARHLHQQGFVVRVWNRSGAKAQALALAHPGIQACDHPLQAVMGADIVVTMLKDAQGVAEVMNAAAPALREGCVWLQMSTVGLAGIADLAALAAKFGWVFYDAPVQGTRGPAELAQLVVLASGPLAPRPLAQQVFDAIGKHTVWVSAQVGDSSRLKLALNAWAFALTHGLAESLALAKGLALDPNLVVEAVTGGPMDSGYFQAKAAAILAEEYDASFAVVNALKDARLVVDAAAAAGVVMDVAQAGLQRFERVVQAGYGDKDMAASYLASWTQAS